MREFISPWGQYLIQYIEYKKLCGYKSEQTEIIASLFDRYYHDLGINEALFTREGNDVNLKFTKMTNKILPVL